MARRGAGGRLAAYEDEVLGLAAEHGGAVVSRVRRAAGANDQPYDVQVIALPDQHALDGYLADPRRAALAPVRDEVVARTEVIRVSQVPLA